MWHPQINILYTPNLQVLCIIVLKNLDSNKMQYCLHIKCKMWTFGKIINAYRFWHLESVLDLLLLAKWKMLVWHVRNRIFMKTNTDRVYYITWANYRKFCDILFSIKKRNRQNTTIRNFRLSAFGRTTFTLNPCRPFAYTVSGDCGRIVYFQRAGQ